MDALHDVDSAHAKGRGSVGRWAGALAGVALVVLSASILYGVILRLLHITDAWSYNLDIFVMVWFGMVGAAYTAHLDSHVTAGISLERRWVRAAGSLRVVRFALTSLYLLALTFFGIILTWQSYKTHMTTWDLALWPLWIAQLAVPVGAFAWFVENVGRFAASVREKR